MVAEAGEEAYFEDFVLTEKGIFKNGEKLDSISWDLIGAPWDVEDFEAVRLHQLMRGRKRDLARAAKVVKFINFIGR
jgi:hypothetical protein